MSPRPLDIGFVHAATDVIVTMHQPGSRGAVVHAGRLLSAVLRNGRLDHYRVSVGQGCVLLAPASWLPTGSRAAVQAAGLPLPLSVKSAGQLRRAWA